MQPTGESYAIRTKDGEQTIVEDGGSLEIDGVVCAPVARLRARTINMGNYESARIEVGVVLFGEDHDALDAIALEAVKELLAREESNVQKSGRRDAPLPDFGGAERVVLRLTFGLTINMGDFESTKTDVGRSIACAPHQVADAWTELRDWTAKRVREDVRDIKSGGF